MSPAGPARLMLDFPERALLAPSALPAPAPPPPPRPSPGGRCLPGGSGRTTVGSLSETDGSLTSGAGRQYDPLGSGHLMPPTCSCPRPCPLCPAGDPGRAVAGVWVARGTGWARGCCGGRVNRMSGVLSVLT